LLLGGLVLGLAIAAYFLVPMLHLMLTTVSTDDAYVNGHVTFVAPRVAGQVKKVLVDDNQRVEKGATLVQLDKVPYQVQVDIKKAAVEVAQRDLVAATAQVHGQVAQARSNRFKLEHAIEDVNNQIANLRAAVAAYKSKKAALELAQHNLERGEDVVKSGGISKEALDQRRQDVKISEAAVEQALEAIHAIRVSLGLPAEPVRMQPIARAIAAQGLVLPGAPTFLPPQATIAAQIATVAAFAGPTRPFKDNELSAVPPNLDQDFSTVRQALADLIQSAAQFGYYPTTWDATPKQTVETFYKQHPEGNLDKIYAHIIPLAPAIKQAEAKLQKAQQDLKDAELNLSYCTIYSEIDGIVTRRNVNPGNNVQVGQTLMAVRSITEIWIDANFKETQLGDLRIGLPVKVEVDMYGRRREFHGRITGFTMGTGQTLSLLPPQNATGNFVKIVQRLPVRIELDDYRPEQQPLFVGLSCVPYVYIYADPIDNDPGKGSYLQPYAPLPKSKE
jgi:membrane fusion protein (multidrug efflux system)